jgi:hypothetical protein
MIHYLTLINYDKLSCSTTKVETIFHSSPPTTNNKMYEVIMDEGFVSGGSR